MTLAEELGIRTDGGGFLIGRKVDLSTERERLMLLRSIKADTAKIAQAVTGSARRQEVARTIARPYMRREAANSPVMHAPPAPAVRRRAVAETAAQRRAVATPKRDSGGRFVAGAGSSQASSERSTGASLSKAASRLGEVAGRIRSSISGALAGSEQVDPSIAAAKEVGDIVSPLSRPLGGLRGMFSRAPSAEIEKAEKKVSVPWFKRIAKTLKEIKDQGAGGLAARGGIGGLLSKLPGAGLLSGLLGGGAAGALAGAGRGRAGRAPGRLGRFGRGLLRRIPLLGGLLAGGSALSSIFGIGDESREERFKGAGGGIGALVGGGLGMLAGPVGAVVGGMLGDMVGTKIGEWMSTVNWSEVGKTITDKWAVVSGKIMEGWEWVRGRFGSVLDSAAQTFGDARKWIAEKFEPVTEIAEQAYVKGKDLLTSGVDAVQPYVDSAKNKVSSFSDAAIVTGGRLAGFLDKGYRHRESFDGIAGGDALASMGTYTNAEAERIRQLKTSGANTSGRMAGGMPASIRNKIIAQARANGLDPEAMLDIANIESGGNPNAISSTGAIGVYQFTGRTATGVGMTDRFDVDQNIQGGMKLALANMQALRKAGLPVTRDSLYMMHQLGPTAAIDLLRGAQEGKRLDQLSQLTQQSAALNVGKGSKTAADYLSANSRALDARLGKVAGAGMLSAPAQSSAAPKVQSVPSAARVAPPTERQQASPATAVPKKVASNDRKAESTLVVEQPLTQNLSDRGLAQAATGGIGMGISGN